MELTSRTFYENAWSECSFFKNVNKLERRQRVRASVMAQLEANPELKEAYRNSSKTFQPSNRNAHVHRITHTSHGQPAAGATEYRRASLTNRVAKGRENVGVRFAAGEEANGFAHRAAGDRATRERRR
jgi:hypothetical protein